MIKLNQIERNKIDCTGQTVKHYKCCEFHLLSKVLLEKFANRILIRSSVRYTNVLALTVGIKFRVNFLGVFHSLNGLQCHLGPTQSLSSVDKLGRWGTRLVELS